MRLLVPRTDPQAPVNPAHGLISILTARSLPPFPRTLISAGPGPVPLPRRGAPADPRTPEHAGASENTTVRARHGPPLPSAPAWRPSSTGLRTVTRKRLLGIIKSHIPAEYLLLSEDGCHCRIEHISARSGWPSAPPAASCGTGRSWPWRGSLEIAKAPAATGVPGAVMGIPAVLIDDGTRRRALPRAGPEGLLRGPARASALCGVLSPNWPRSPHHGPAARRARRRSMPLW